MTTKLSQHFSLEELTYSETALRHEIDNTPPPSAVENLKRLCETLLEPVRGLVLVPMHINSGFRSAALNVVVGGAHTSAHLAGCAADFIPIGLDLRTTFDMLRQRVELPYDQIIFECSAWIHIAAAPAGLAPRRQALTATGHAGAWAYQLVEGTS
jgi:hypothetical protein